MIDCCHDLIVFVNVITALLLILIGFCFQFLSLRRVYFCVITLCASKRGITAFPHLQTAYRSSEYFRKSFISYHEINLFVKCTWNKPMLVQYNQTFWFILSFDSRPNVCFFVSFFFSSVFHVSVTTVHAKYHPLVIAITQSFKNTVLSQY